MPALSTRLTDPDAIPYFLWDDPMTVSELEERLRTASEPEQLRLRALILREARDPDVWQFVSPEEVVRLCPHLAGRLGVRRGFWEFLLAPWKRLGLVRAISFTTAHLRFTPRSSIATVSSWTPPPRSSRTSSAPSSHVAECATSSTSCSWKARVFE